MGPWEAALRYLSYRPRSEAEVRQHLLRRFPPEQVAEAIARLHASGLLDDAAFARYWVERRHTASPRGRGLVEMELRSKGVSRDVAARAAAGLDEEAAARRAAQRLLRRLKGEEPMLLRRKLYAALRRRGFSGEVVRRVMGEVGG